MQEHCCLAGLIWFCYLLYCSLQLESNAFLTCQLRNTNIKFISWVKSKIKKKRWDAKTTASHRHSEKSLFLIGIGFWPQAILCIPSVYTLSSIVCFCGIPSTNGRVVAIHGIYAWLAIQVQINWFESLRGVLTNES